MTDQEMPQVAETQDVILRRLPDGRFGIVDPHSDALYAEAGYDIEEFGAFGLELRDFLAQV